MAFKSIGQKYGFVSAGDVFRQRIADAVADAEAKAQKLIGEERQKAELERQKAENAEAEKLNTAKKLVRDGVLSIENAISYFGYSNDQLLSG